jgi:hypothetical protein
VTHLRRRTVSITSQWVGDSNPALFKVDAAFVPGIGTMKSPFPPSLRFLTVPRMGRLRPHEPESRMVGDSPSKLCEALFFVNQRETLRSPIKRLKNLCPDSRHAKRLEARSSFVLSQARLPMEAPVQYHESTGDI